jgi:hypothetical protein
MLATPQIIETNVQEAAIIRLTVPRSEMMKVFGPAVGELMAALAAHGVRVRFLPYGRSQAAPNADQRRGADEAAEMPGAVARNRKLEYHIS